MKSGYISIIGKPNSGKSTLLNKILGEQLSIVTRKAQTTRHKIVGIHNLPNAQMIFLDTPGIHDSKKPLNEFMMEQVDKAVKDADVICYVVDVRDSERLLSHPRENGDPVQLSELDSRFRGNDKDLGNDNNVGNDRSLIIVLNKLDKIIDKPWEQIINDYKEKFPNVEVLGISAKTGHGVGELILKLVEHLPEGESFYPDNIYTEHPVRFLVSEIVREQTLNLLHEELPYAIAVQIEKYKEKPDIHHIHASIIVEKDSQKGMVIGSGGKMIKKIGKLSRSKIEALVKTKVFLKLFVKVEKNWTKKDNLIKKFHS